MGYESGGTSRDGRDEDDEDEYEEAGGGNRLLGFMFGNVDYSGDLDVDYLDEDAKEHLAALADKLGPSLTEIDLSAKSPQASADVAEQDYDEKAEDAVDYEDIDEQYEGPEIQTVTEEDLLLPKRDYFSSEVALATLENRASVFDDENYDEDDNEEEKEQEVVENTAEVPSTPEKGEYNDDAEVIFHGKKLPEEVLSPDAPESSEDVQEEEPITMEEPVDGQSSLPLPVLCVEDGMAILKFSEIFALHEPRKKADKRERRCSVPEDKYKAMDTLDIVEEDEVTLLRGSYQDFPWLRKAPVHQDSALTFLDNEPGTVQGIDELKPKIEKTDSCCSAKPMKENLSMDLSANWSSPICPEFYPLDQQDWEDRIIWDNSPPVSDNTAESCEISGPDCETLTHKQLDVEAESQCFQSEKEIEPREKGHSSFFSCSVSVEPFGSKQPSGHLDISLSEGRYHPQLLRLQSRLNADRQKSTDTVKDGATDESLSSDALRRFSKLTLQNRDIMEESWVDNIIWEPDQPFPKPKLIYDLQDEQMLFEVLDNRDGQQLLHHAGAMITTGLMKPSNGDSAELYGLGGLSGRFNIANDKFYLNRKSTQQLKSHSKKRTAHGLKVLHSIPALKLQTMKAKLSNKDIANFHRPRALWHPHDNEVVLKEQRKLPTQGPMKIILKSLGGKGSKLHVAAEETISSLKSKASKKLDFKLSEPVKIIYCGKELEDVKSLSAQNVPPNSVLHLVRSRINLLPRAQKLPGENKSMRPPGAFKKKSDLSVKDGHVFLMEYCEERPLLLGNAGMGARLCTYYQKSSPNDQKGTLMRNENTGLGSVLILDPADKSPFLGDIKPGCSQSSLETNMYRAPIFQHKVSSTDYLLVRSAKGKLSIRRIDRIDVVGQQEPHMEVISPGSKGVQTYIMNRLLVYMYREFRAIEKRGSRPFIRADELSAQFPSLSEAFLRKRLKHCADLQRRSNGQLQWVMRFNFRIPSEEELRRLVSPESVCAYESMQAGLYRLKRLGITRLTHPAGLSAAMNQLPDEAIALAAASHIERELQITPWNLSSNFVACTNQDRENIERLEITGVGDPSGRGLGFSYVRTTPKAPISNAISKKKTVVAKGSTVTGTDADLRRLSMEAAREVLLKFNVPEEQIAKLTRWHRIAMIRKLSSEQAASGVKVDPTTISKYARGQRMSFLQLQQQTREKCQEIWDRQVQNLSAVDGEENESDSEVNSDLDSFAGDLENLLDAEECEDGEEGSHEPKHDNVDGVKGLKMRRRSFQAQVEEEIEDEAAEAAELCRMLMDDEEADRKKKKKDKVMGEQIGVMPDLRYRFGTESTDRGKKPQIFSKPSIKSDGPNALDFIGDQKELQAEVFATKRTLSSKVKSKKKFDIVDTGLFNKKVKILGDGIKPVKEKKSARDSFVCGACGQLGHMRTNKNCPKYGEDVDARAESTDLEKTTGKAISSIDPLDHPQIFSKKVIQKSGTKNVMIEVHEDDNSSSKAKVLKVKCGSTDKLPDKPTPATSFNSDMPVTSDAETGTVPPPIKFNKIKFSNKMRAEDISNEAHKPSILIRPPTETADSQRSKKIVIKQLKDSASVDESFLEGSSGMDFRKTKKINELSYLGQQDREHFFEEALERKRMDDKRLWEEEERRRVALRQREERAKMIYERQKALEEQEKLAAIESYQDAIRREREEEERLKEKKKKKKKPEIRDEYLDDFLPRRNDRRIPDRDRSVKRRQPFESGRHAKEHAPPAKRRRAGEVGLSNILEEIVDTLKSNVEVSYLFLKPVTRKEAPDYHKYVKRPMDLSTIKEKARKLEYKNRGQFRHDVAQITINAHIYNDVRNPGIPPLADQLLEICDYLLEENDSILAEAEAGIGR
ncbi:transcription initiation factor TFIID subunit 1 isoform X1 [Nicotiana tomentosiformis]|uniref:transcription initiation factor TFIID subunit 1 isoform X1 n=1 Tax=Nicotiana tomentosiformis TaxID=4098 RepID=UPI00051C2420|nr:transcription initiation factor TFIID subunit 1 isoform X1 [Nicotiana tomentosiformis]XP_009614598.1 transcription initiation factor TFIID subunit 1 isoform X1 [Nicotiana tomentosiformis]XP_009614599.1 transcription initiation factor TFIID subunit 1 isoform X1 [Nicotiana tomentosiformis]XP_009614601.1 transcription initiation factor TFIID subunit 1 isoform X1 [Nicotiana tomentosiformis]XP_009614602.1 transcription initiation factor TFIID subunit 1 isoform X1 [Nicotiana tomentosiformis]XP_03